MLKGLIVLSILVLGLMGALFIVAGLFLGRVMVRRPRRCYCKRITRRGYKICAVPPPVRRG